MLFLIAAQLRAHDRGVVQLVWECARSLWLNVNAMRILRSNFEEDSLFLNLSSYPIARRGAIAVAPIKFEIALAMTDMTMRVVLLEAVAGGRRWWHGRQVLDELHGAVDFNGCVVPSRSVAINQQGN